MTTAVGHVEEGFVDLDGNTFYAIPNVDRLGPFLMSMLNDSDLWMFVSSRGGLTAGRGDAGAALFPYETDDRLHTASGIAGPITLIRPAGATGVAPWEPFMGMASPGIERNLYKSVVGNQIVFEEINQGLGLAFRYRWSASDRFGFSRDAELTNFGGEPVTVDVLDGLVNLLPDGLQPATYRAMSNLTNAYKRSEVIDAPNRVAVYSLEAGIVDRPEPAEVLKASVVWSIGLGGAEVGVDAQALQAFRRGHPSPPGSLVTGRPGAYLLGSHEQLAPGATTRWTIVADVRRDQADVVELLEFLREAADPLADVAGAISLGTDSLVKLVGRADAVQQTGDRVASVHHFANVAFNVMRGGVFVSGTDIRSRDFADFLRVRHLPTATRHATWLDELPAVVARADLLEEAEALGDPQLIRLSLEYLPLTFSRRHGDPSRPWNAFSIRLRDGDGRPVIHYEGNWRDIFQNWEALCLSFPAYLPSIVSVFLNASTPDGFNPYRITSEGIDWETPEPDNPWSNIGYWGDHQIVYLLRILEMTHHYLPGTLDGMVGREWFSYADVPYRIAPYEAIVRNPRSTIEFDEAAAARTAARVEKVGQDGKLLPNRNGVVHLVSMAEKLLVPALAKLSSLIPGGGIWMNTQRPEWNDANNALVGNGLSMVTTCYLRRYLEQVARLLERSGVERVNLSTEVAEWLGSVTKILHESDHYLGDGWTDARRRKFVDRLGHTFTDYRLRVYADGFSGSTSVPVASITATFENAIRHLDDTIHKSRREDGLYGSYSLAHFAPDGSTAFVEHLGPMLEGQVAVLSSGVLSLEDRLRVVDALYASSLYRADQNSFMLYPARIPPSFLVKNVIPEEQVTANPLLRDLVGAGETSIIRADAAGSFRFNADFKNARDLARALDRLAEARNWHDLVSLHRAAVMEVYEMVFNHHAYTGRSGSMYGYEGIGSIYWHMVAKLLVAVQESIREAVEQQAAPDLVAGLVAAYWRIRSGLGFEKTAAAFGAFPTDPYSHTPAHAGAQQPGMTGQVKEEILTRLYELGVRVDDGAINFDATLLRPSEFVAYDQTWSPPVLGDPGVIDLPVGSFGLTFCQVPIVVAMDAGPGRVVVTAADGSTVDHEGLRLDQATSAGIFARTEETKQVQVFIPSSHVVG